MTICSMQLIFLNTIASSMVTGFIVVSEAYVSVHSEQICESLQYCCTPSYWISTFGVGNNRTHSSHYIITHGVVNFCKRCGAAARNKLLKLSAPCQISEANSYGNIITAYSEARRQYAFLNGPVNP